MATMKKAKTEDVRALFTTFIADLNAAFPQRREVIEGVFLAVLTQQHVLLLGPPGTAKSLLTRSIGTGLGGRWFELLLTRFTTPEEPFGPVSLKALEQDRFERKLDGKLADVEFAFLDEIFKANSAILNALLTAINERVIHNGSGPQPIPLRTVFGASNEMPEGKDLEALWDRFVLRYNVEYLRRDDDLRALLGAPVPAVAPGLTLADLDAAQAEVRAVTVTDPTVDALLAVRSALKAEGIVISDRRWRACLALTQASAWLAGDAETSPEHLGVLIDALWREPKERVKVAKIVGQIADPASAKAVEILDAARETSARLAAAQSGDRDAYLATARKGLEEMRQILRKLDEISKGATGRSGATIADVRVEVKALHDDLTRVIAQSLGLR